MFTLIVGAAASGKSAYAESVAFSYGGCPRVYVATLDPCDAESRTRIERHRVQRAGGNFVTIDCPRNLVAAASDLPRGASVLVDTLGTLVANELYTPDGSLANPQDVVQAVVRGVQNIASAANHLTIVTDEVFSGGASYAGETLAYLRVLAQINRALACEADRVVEVVAGCPVVLKEVLP